MVASNRELAESVAAAVAATGGTAEEVATSLGVDYAAGKYIKYQKAKERLKKAAAKKDAVMSYCNGGWRVFNVVRAHVVPAAMLGTPVHGVPSNGFRGYGV